MAHGNHSPEICASGVHRDNWLNVRLLEYHREGSSQPKEATGMLQESRYCNGKPGLVAQPVTLAFFGILKQEIKSSSSALET